jgi:ADP-ribose pyrophosphatase YjhB (NUDIX family)
MLRLASVARSIVLFCLPLRLRAVKAVIRSADGQVLLVRHSYGSGRWMFPGGLVRRGEPYERAVAREMAEELGVAERSWVQLAEYTPRKGLTKQRLALLTTVVDPASIVTNHEIAEVCFVEPSDIPVGTSGATSRRLSELVAGTLQGGAW